MKAGKFLLKVTSYHSFAQFEGNYDITGFGLNEPLKRASKLEVLTFSRN